MGFIQDYWFKLPTDAVKNWMRIDGYFTMFYKLVQSSSENPEFYNFFIGHDLIACYVDFMIENGSPVTLVPKNYSLGTKSNPVNFNSGLSAIYFLLKRVLIHAFSHMVSLETTIISLLFHKNIYFISVKMPFSASAAMPFMKECLSKVKTLKV